MSGLIFVDREKELEDLRRFYSLSINSAMGGIIVYGWRKVGKSMLIDKFLEEVPGFRINCAWISDPETFGWVVIDKLQRLLEDDKILSNLRLSILEKGNLMVLLKKIFDTINIASSAYGAKLVVALDEIHKFLDKIATRIARESKKSKSIVYNDILWMLKDVIEKKEVFWILMSSVGWVKLREILEISKIKENPLLGLLTKYEVRPFNINAAKQLALIRNRQIPEPIVRELHRISGGIPILIDIISTMYDPSKGLLEQIINIVQRGLLDEFFENMMRFVAEVVKRDYVLLIRILKSFRGEYATSEEVAKNAHIDRTSAYILLEELHKCGILEKEKKGKLVKFKILYPLITLWLDIRTEPQKRIIDVIASRLGITAEYYIQELLKKFEEKELAIWDDKSGTYLLGTTDQINYKIRKVYTKEETDKLLGHKNADLIIELQNDDYLLIEIKAKIKDIEPKDIQKLDEIRKEFERKTGKRTHATVILVGTGTATLPAIREAIKREIPIITDQAIKILAKRVGMPHY